MSGPKEDNSSVSTDSEISSHIFRDLLDSVIVDAASESHRIIKLGLDRNLEAEEEELRRSAEARIMVAESNSGDIHGKPDTDIFGQTHPPVAKEIFECMNCGRSIMAGKFAPHLEKCMGKGRNARAMVTRSSKRTKNRRYSLGSPVSTYTTGTARPSNEKRGAANNST